MGQARAGYAVYIVCVLGLVLSSYGLYVENQMAANPDFVALCDLGSWASCSKVFHSKYGSGLGIISSDSFLSMPNTVYGLVYYTLHMVLQHPSLFNNPSARTLAVVLGVASIVTSVWLAYVLYFILKDFCILCVSTYVLNAVTLFSALSDQRRVATAGKKKA
mmetsp:Transcript_56946/g.139749  ORF Transcript_56946/g.139749 Transcript_56946/m.139749 type:complete len:162 (+) Transcript_56946:89-574(+)